jgi:hypothetical protein
MIVTNWRPPSSSRYFLGLDLGQAHDFTAIAVVERAVVPGEWDPALYTNDQHDVLRLRHLDRLPLGTPYPEIVESIRALADSSELQDRCTLAVDATGVGRPVVDLLNRAGLSMRILAVTITGGAHETGHGSYYSVPQRDLIAGIQVLLQNSGLQVAAGLAHGPAFLSELAEMRLKITPAGRASYGAWRAGAHDDLVFAVALACWAARESAPVPLDGQHRLL